MPEIVIVSGKGGTGKTTFAGAFTAVGEKAVYADCDVDAANFHLIMNPEVIAREDFFGMPVPAVNTDLCTKCGECTSACRYGAIADGAVNLLSCERCAVCYWVCPEHAIKLVPEKSGEIRYARTPFGQLVYAELGVAQENSGLLVAEVKKRARRIVDEEGAEYLIVDGPPGIGCPVIASLCDADLGIVVTEPTKAGLHDLERVAKVCGHFGVPVIVVINKWDLNPAATKEIEDYCRKARFTVAGKVPFERQVVEVHVQGRAVSGKEPIGRTFTEIWKRILSWEKSQRARNDFKVIRS